MRKYSRGLVLRDSSAAADAPLRVVATTEGLKGDGINLTMANADLGRFLANPVIGYGHDYWGRAALPIGRAVATEIDGTRLMHDLEFDQGDPFATEVERKLRGGYLNAVSVGFDAHDIGKDGVPARWELFETSVVPLPMDPDALVESGRGRDAGMLARFLAEARAGKVLSKKNQSLLEDAVAALSALLDSAASNDSEDDDGRSRQPERPRLTAALARLGSS